MSAPPRISRVRLALVLGGLSAFGPLSIDMYLPAFPELATSLGTGPAQVQLTLTTFMIGLAVGQVVAGPLSDSLGRRGPLLVGLGLYVVSSLVCAVAPSVYTLVGLRFAQGVAAAAGVVIARAAVRDVFSGAAMARFFSALMLVNGLGPLLAPVIGAQVLRWTSWSGIFVVLACFGAALLVATLVWLPETLPRDHRGPARLGRTLRTFVRIGSDRTFVAYAVSAGCVLASMFAYIAGSSFVLQDIHGLGPRQYSLVFAANALGIMLVAQLNSLLLRWTQPRALLVAGLVVGAVGGLGVLVAVAADLGLWWLLAALFVSVSSVGMISPNSTALALAEHGRDAGAASALIGVLQFVIGGIASPLVGLGGGHTALPMAIVIAVLSVGGIATFALMRPSAPQSAPERADEGGGEDGQGALGAGPGLGGGLAGEPVGDVEDLASQAGCEHPK
ncbi:MFS transporter, DHA1 family, bicyclomycin/chloramphenicol resistance protein [Actinokineospora diospyrosa]|uniref:MFS transporter, DHA1 family, bicyclomycin/chloramphenicol resistance protein n=1 Tax=Actinokineospora diospyrosa TaxID=103728 RepID=A0ABT1IAG8_9PSEU|nr:MFS transporter, DHA1 family, bicyclomycin/chloramphenicol resistance protein [Actinokineospora diospyrosa]